MGAEGQQCVDVCWHCVVSEEADDHLLQPRPLCGDRVVPSPAQLVLDLLELCGHAIASSLPKDQEVPSARFAADKGKAQKVEGFRFSEPALFAIDRRVATKL